MQAFKTPTIESAIPTYLIYEWISGRPVYYRGYQKVMEGQTKPEDIMGYGELQIMILNIIGDHLKNLFGKSAWVLVGESGLHIDHKNNPSVDLIIYPRAALSLRDGRKINDTTFDSLKFSKQLTARKLCENIRESLKKVGAFISVKQLNHAKVNYLSLPPQTIIEVDTKADPTILHEMDYFHEKTQALLDFGTKEVVWIFTSTRKVMIARPNAPWLTVDWSYPIQINSQELNIEAVLAAA